MRYAVVLRSAAFAYITVDADDSESAVDAAIEASPNICAQCSGWGRQFSLELSDDWDTESVEVES